MIPLNKNNLHSVVGGANTNGNNGNANGPAPMGLSTACTLAGAVTGLAVTAIAGPVAGMVAGTAMAISCNTAAAVATANPNVAPPSAPPAPPAPTTVAESSGGDGGSPCVICTQLTRTGNMDISTWSAAQRYGNERFSAQVMNGYHAWGVPYVKLMRKSPMFAAIAKRPVNWFAEDLAYRMGVRAKPNYMGWALRELAFRPVCWSIGVFAKARDFQHLWTGKVAMA